MSNENEGARDALKNYIVSATAVFGVAGEGRVELWRQRVATNLRELEAVGA